MTHLSKRLDRLEAQRGGDAVTGPSVIFIAEAGGETHAALFRGGSGASRLDGETEAAFIARAEKAASTKAQRGDN
jgi:hypothetical protein